MNRPTQHKGASQGPPIRAAVTVALAAVAACASTAQGQVTGEHNLGVVNFPVSCAEAAQAEFNRAVALLHHMTYPRARQAFERVARIDATCAMAHWGIAMTLFQPLWPTRPGLPDLRRGWDAVETARRLGLKTDRERVLVDAAAAFFQGPESPDYWQRIRRWEAAMARAQATFPDDPEVTAFFALAHLSAAPADDRAVAAHSERASALLIKVHDRYPDHPGAMHYLVHAADVPGRERTSLHVTAQYESVAPRNPHALHMPTHIYTRLGDWNAVVRGNLLAADAALENPAGDRGQFVWDEFPHAVEYLVYAYLQQGADREAETELSRLHTTPRLQPSFKTAFHIASTRARYALERRAWHEASALAVREAPDLDWDRFPWAEAVTWFARGLGSARMAQIDAARAAATRLSELELTARGAGEELFARNIRILRLEVSAWLAHANKDTASSRALMREAIELEVATPKHAVTPAPTLPAYELGGDLLLEEDAAVQALRMYQRSLELYPGRFNSLLGAARAAVASNDASSARKYYDDLLRVAAQGGRTAAVDEARRYLGR